MFNENNNQYYIDVDKIKDKSVIGGINHKIEANMANMGLENGEARSGRGKSGKDKRNASSATIEHIKASKEYRNKKANAGK